MHIHFWWACIDTSVPPVLGADCSWGSQQPEKVHQGCSQWFMSRSQGWACLVRETKDLAAWWEAWGAGACTVLRPPAWETHTSLQFCVGWPMQAACSSCSVGPPHLSCAVPLSTSGCSGIFAPHYKKGSPFTVFLYKIWSCLVVRTELLGSGGSPKFSSLFGPRLLLSEYML